VDPRLEPKDIVLILLRFYRLEWAILRLERSTGTWNSDGGLYFSLFGVSR